MQHLPGVDVKRIQRRPDRHVVAVQGSPVAVIADGRGEPAAVRGQVGGRRHEAEAHRHVARRLPRRQKARPGQPGAAESGGVPGDREAGERRQVPQGVPLRRARQADANPGQHAPPADAARQCPLATRRQTEPGQPPVPVDDEAAECGEDPEHQEDVQHRGTAHDELQPVGRQQQASDAAEHRRAGHPARDPGRHQNGQRPGDRGSEPPAKRREPEHPLTRGDQDLAQRGMSHELAAGGQDVRAAVQEQGGSAGAVVDLGTVPEDSVRIRHVVELVRDQGARSCEPAEAQRPACGGDDEHPGPVAGRGTDDGGPKAP